MPLNSSQCWSLVIDGQWSALGPTPQFWLVLMGIDRHWAMIEGVLSFVIGDKCYQSTEASDQTKCYIFSSDSLQWPEGPNYCKYVPVIPLQLKRKGWKPFCKISLFRGGRTSFSMIYKFLKISYIHISWNIIDGTKFLWHILNQTMTEVKSKRNPLVILFPIQKFICLNIFCESTFCMTFSIMPIISRLIYRSMFSKKVDTLL